MKTITFTQLSPKQISFYLYSFLFIVTIGVLIIDTPGLGDSGGNDTRHIYDMVDILKQLAVANIFLRNKKNKNKRGKGEDMEITVAKYLVVFDIDINIFIVLFNGQQPRYDEPLQTMLNTFVGVSKIPSTLLTPFHIFSCSFLLSFPYSFFLFSLILVNIFGIGFLRHTILGFSRWGFDEASKRRRRQNNFSEDSRRTRYAGMI